MNNVKQEMAIVSFFPNSSRDNPYLNLLEEGLNQCGIQVFPTDVDRPFVWWLKKYQGEIDVLHFHWLHYIYQRNTYVEALERVIKFVIQLAYAKSRGYRIVWTVHNLFPHERPYPHLDLIVRRAILAYADAVIVHCNSAKEKVWKELRRRKNIIVAPLGNYISAYPTTVNKEQSRRVLGIEGEAFLYLHFGAIREYKGLASLISAFHSIDNQKARLIIAGRSYGDLFERETKNLLEKDNRIRVITTWITEDETPYYFKAADVFVAPFTNVLTSSSVMLALSFGLPVVVSRLGCLPELVTPKVGFLVKANDRSDLYNALIACERGEVDLSAMGEEALRIARLFDWADTAKLVKTAYEL